MDADTRHQLKQNDLAEALARIRDFSDKRTLAWIAVIVIVGLGYAGYRYVAWQNARALTAAYQSLANARTTISDPSRGDAALSRLRQLISENEDPKLVAWSRLQLGAALSARAEGDDAATKLEQAEGEFQAVLQLPVDKRLFKAPARYRLGLLYETKRDFTRAREMYADLERDPEYDGSPFVELAKERLQKLDELAIAVKFEPGVKPLPETPEEPEPASEPVAASEAPLEPVLEIDELANAPPQQPVDQPAPTTQPETAETAAEEPPSEETEPQQP